MAGTAFNTSGVTSLRCATAQKELESDRDLNSFAFLGICSATAGTKLSTSGATSFRFTTDHKQLDKASGANSAAWTGTSSAKAGKACSTCGATSFSLAIAQRQIETSCGFIFPTLLGITNASWDNAVGMCLSFPPDNTAKAQKTFAMLRGDMSWIICRSLASRLVMMGLLRWPCLMRPHFLSFASLEKAAESGISARLSSRRSKRWAGESAREICLVSARSAS
mmetsp:Transcript_5388/g.12416  ORF Transcript_5388/g.12416 Transcript_5388/m.12416 type:complete len:223 (+) Transcript_5388:554-1222(+)